MALSAIRSFVSGNFSPINLIPPQVDRVLANLMSRKELASSIQQAQQLSDADTALFQELQARCQMLSKCACSLAPRFTNPFEVKVYDGSTMTRGGNVIYLSKRDLCTPFGISSDTASQKEARLTAMVAHEIGHCILRHQIKFAASTGISSGMLAATLKALYSKSPRLTKTTKCIALLMALPVGVKVAQYAHRLINSMSRSHEREADGVAALLLAKYNTLCSEDQQVPDTVLKDVFQYLARINKHNPSTHPTTQQRQTIASKATLMLRKHPDLLTNLSKRRKFFAELQQDRPANDPAFMTQWDLSEADLFL